MSPRKDSLDNQYEPIIKLEKAIAVFFWLILGVSVATMFAGNELWTKMLSGIFIVLIVLFCIISNYVRIYLIPQVETERRDHLLSDALGVHLNHEKTEGYYNNNINSSIIKLGANIFENTLHATSVVAKMLIIARIKICIYVIAVILLLCYQGINLSVVAVITQAVFSGEIISKWLYMEKLRVENQQIFEKMNEIFLGYTENKNKEFEAMIISQFSRYESAKAYCGILQSTKIFNKYNKENSLKWDEIRKKYNI